MDVPHRLGAETLGLPFGFQPVYPPTGQQLLRGTFRIRIETGHIPAMNPEPRK